jgi:acyl-CoA reductase-like NAD-dependent aldehyde dehydrogenase
VTLELGGNAATIVDADANIDAAVARTVFGSFSYSGQVCISVQRILIHAEQGFGDYCAYLMIKIFSLLFLQQGSA